MNLLSTGMYTIPLVFRGLHVTGRLLVGKGDANYGDGPAQRRGLAGNRRPLLSLGGRRLLVVVVPFGRSM